MAKSIRSKRRRKMRNVKREKYGKKELERLKTVVQKAQTGDVVMEDLATVVTTEEAKKRERTKKDNPASLKNEHGNYPVWMSQRKVRKVKKQQVKARKTAEKKKKQNK